MSAPRVHQSQSGQGALKEHVLNLDWVLIASTIITVLTGIFMVHSTEAVGDYGYLIRQSTAAVIGFIGLIFLTLVHYQIYREYIRPLYILMLLVLIGVLIFGVNLRGTRGWFSFGKIYIQASEVAKFLFVLTLAGYLDRRIQWYSPQALVKPLFLAMVPIGLILLQPDLSSSLVFFPVTLVMFYVAGARTLHLLGICLVGGLAATVPLAATYFRLIEDELVGRPVWSFLSQAFQGGMAGLWLFLGVCGFLIFVWWFMRKMRVYVPSLYLWVTLFLIALGTMGAMVGDSALKDYQRKRLVAFVNPNIDPLGSGYNVRQSQIAIGSGQLTGKGYRQGTQSRLGFLPSRHTDFIFSVIGEEFGFFRSVLVLAFYFLIIWRGYEISQESRDRYGSLVASGFASMFAFYALLNLGMCMGMAPVAGVPLPLISYGGSSVVSSLLAIGVLLSIHWRRFLLDRG